MRTSHVAAFVAVLATACGGRVDGEPAGVTPGTDAGGQDAASCTQCIGASTELPDVRLLRSGGGRVFAFTEKEIREVKDAATVPFAVTDCLVTRAAVTAAQLAWVCAGSDDVRVIALAAPTSVKRIPASKPAGVDLAADAMAVTLGGSAFVEIRDGSGAVDRRLGPVPTNNPSQIYLRGEIVVWADPGPPSSSNDGTIYRAFRARMDSPVPMIAGVRSLLDLVVGNGTGYLVTADGTVWRSAIDVPTSEITTTPWREGIGRIEAAAGDDESLFIAVAREGGGSKLLRVAGDRTDVVASSPHVIRAITVTGASVIWADESSLHRSTRDCTCR